jgi:restriction system protein
MKTPPRKGPGGPVARERPSPFHEHRHRWLIPDWATRMRPPRNAREWGYTGLGSLVAVMAVWLLLRQALAHPFIALAVLAGVWWLVDRWCRARWAHEKVRRERLAALSWTIGELDGMTWLNFEVAVRDLMRRDGIAAEHVGKTGDFSGDVVGLDPVLGENWMVQVKHYGPRTKVTSEDVQKVAGAAWPIYQAKLTLVVTTNTYTRDARKFAAKAGMHLIDREGLIDWAARGIHLYEVLGIAPRPQRSAS